MAVRIRMKRLGRKHRPFFRMCAVDSRKTRDGKVIEYLGHYDPMVPETDARASLNGERIDYWLSVGAQPSEKCRVLIKKYGTQGTHLQQREEALGRLQASKPTAPPPVPIAKPKAEEPAAPAAEAPAAAEEAAAEAPAEEAAAEAEPAAAEASADAGESSGEGEENKTESGE